MSATRIAIGVDVGSTTVKAVVCDPDTGECTGGGSDFGGGSDGSSTGAVASATPTARAASSGWSSTQTLTVLFAGRGLAGGLGPALLWRNLARQAKSP